VVLSLISDILPKHHADVLRMNETFVHWLSALDQAGLNYILDRATYAKQIDDGAGVLIGYAHDVDYPDHQNLAWLKARLDNLFYIDRVIIDETAQGRGFGRQLYTDVEAFARTGGYDWLTCEVNTVPDNPSSHRFHQAAGFEVFGAQNFPKKGTAVRYYVKALK